ncbi:hypothetical protein [Promicromonospora sp. NPDC090134]|uniref:hypothetical protein n=1 Tax=Promicromonospora sp. NPDC090134 TaxID=3364408 RepID=UPI00382749F8
MVTTVRLAYFDDKEPLVRDVVLPALEEVAALPGVDGAWARSHWLRGPHLLLHVTGPAAPDAAAGLAERLRAHLAAHPSRARLDESGYAATSAELGRLELVAGPYLPLWPDGSVEVVDTTTGDTFVRTPAAERAKGRIMAAGTAVLRTVLTAGTTPVTRADAAFLGMAAIAVAYPRHGLVSGYQAFLSHWKECFFWYDADGRADAALTASFEAQRDLLCDRLRTIQAGGEAARQDPVAAAWLDWVDAALPIALERAEAGDVLPYPHPERAERAATFDDATAVRWSGSDERGYSDYHRAFRQLDFTALGNGSDFAAYRFLVNCFFDLLTVLGVTPMQRYSVAHLLTDAAQVVVGEPWQITVERAVTRQSAQAVPTLPWRGDAGE